MSAELWTIVEQVLISCMRDVVLGLSRLTEHGTDLATLRSQQSFIYDLERIGPHEIAKNLWSVGISQARGMPADLPAAITFFKQRIGNGKKGKFTTIGRIEEELKAVRIDTLAHMKLNRESRVLVRRRRLATILVCSLVQAALLIIEGHIWNPRRQFWQAMKKANTFWDIIEKRPQATHKELS